MSFTVRTVVATFNDADGSPSQGEVTFDLTDEMMNDGTIAVPGQEIAAALDDTGSISVSLTANDDTDTVPTGVQWRVTLRISNADPMTYSVTVPSAGSGSVMLESLLPGAPQVS